LQYFLKEKCTLGYLAARFDTSIGRDKSISFSEAGPSTLELMLASHSRRPALQVWSKKSSWAPPTTLDISDLI
jgi:hypothetical protein